MRATPRKKRQSHLPLVCAITVATGAWLRAAATAIGTGTAWCVSCGRMVRLEHRGHVQARLDSAHSTAKARPADE
jgi:hypothetical protein